MTYSAFREVLGEAHGREERDRDEREGLHFDIETRCLTVVEEVEGLMREY